MSLLGHQENLFPVVVWIQTDAARQTHTHAVGQKISDGIKAEI